jgi:uncharacterized protein YgiM (DUF1202 family)
VVSVSRLFWSALLFMGIFAASAAARPAVTRDSTRLREGPSRTGALLAELPAGTRLEVVGERDGWMQVETQDGRSGFVWGDHLAANEGAPRAAERRADPDTAAPSVLDEVRTLRSEVGALRDRPEPATAADLERVRGELAQLAQSSRELSQRLASRLAAADPDPSPDGIQAVSWIFLFVGVVIGWTGSRLTQRRDRRQRPRLRV